MGSFNDFITAHINNFEANDELNELQKIFNSIELKDQSKFKFDYFTYINNSDIFSAIDKKLVRKEIDLLISNLFKSSDCFNKINMEKFATLQTVYSSDSFLSLADFKDFTFSLENFIKNEIQHLELIKELACPPTNSKRDTNYKLICAALNCEFEKLLDANKSYRHLKFSKRKSNYAGIFDNLDDKGITSGQPTVSAYKLTALSYHAFGRPITETQVKYIAKQMSKQ